MNRKICVVSGSRAEFGLLRWLMDEIKSDHDLSLQVIVTGMHLSPEFGSTYKEIEEAGFLIDERVDMLLSSDSNSAVTKSIGLGIIGFADIFEKLKPDLLVVLGDRFEIFSATSAAMVAGLPIAHIHGGETTEGAYDEAIRHSITKMSHLHFVATEEYRKRVIQLGEHPDRVFNFGGLGVDAIKKIKLLNKKDLELALNMHFLDKSLLVTFHPVTLEDEEYSFSQMEELLLALKNFKDTSIIFTLPNADTGGKKIADLVNKFVELNPNCKLYKSLGQLKYLSCLKQVDGVIGNSSSGLLEAPSFKVGTINIGDRQKGRIMSNSVINCHPTKDAISKAINKLYDPSFKESLTEVINPYGDGGASEKIVEVLRNHSLMGIKKKIFHNVPFDNS